MQVFVVVLVCALSTSAFADLDRVAARAAFQRGSQHYDLGEFGPALTDFRQAFVLSNEPDLLFNIAQCYRRLGLKQEAIEMYRNYLHRAPVVADTRKAQANLDELLHEQAEAHKQKGQPVWRKWWFWTSIAGGVAVAGAAVGLGVGLTQRSSTPLATTELGSFRF